MILLQRNDHLSVAIVNIFTKISCTIIISPGCEKKKLHSLLFSFFKLFQIIYLEINISGVNLVLIAIIDIIHKACLIKIGREHTSYYYY